MKDLNTLLFKKYLDNNINLDTQFNPSLLIEPRKQANRLYELFDKDSIFLTFGIKHNTIYLNNIFDKQILYQPYKYRKLHTFIHTRTYYDIGYNEQYYSYSNTYEYISYYYVYSIYIQYNSSDIRFIYIFQKYKCMNNNYKVTKYNTEQVNVRLVEFDKYVSNTLQPFMLYWIKDNKKYSFIEDLLLQKLKLYNKTISTTILSYLEDNTFLQSGVDYLTIYDDYIKYHISRRQFSYINEWDVFEINKYNRKTIYLYYNRFQKIKQYGYFVENVLYLMNNILQYIYSPFIKKNQIYEKESLLNTNQIYKHLIYNFKCFYSFIESSLNNKIQIIKIDKNKYKISYTKLNSLNEVEMKEDIITIQYNNCMGIKYKLKKDKKHSSIYYTSDFYDTINYMTIH